MAKNHLSEAALVLIKSDSKEDFCYEVVSYSW